MTHPLNILALAPDPGSDPAVGAGSPPELPSGAEVVRVRGVTDFLRSLAARDWAASVIPLSGEWVSEAVVERIARAPGCGALFLTVAHPSLEAALFAQRVGAQALLTEPVAWDEILRRVEPLAAEGAEIALPERPPERGSARESEPAGPELIGRSPAMARVFDAVARVASSQATVLLTGESGTGKEVVARILHETGPRRGGPFVPVNCAAIPENLLESELFGHEKGAFTGAVANRVGRFERADGGTLFLDEIGDMSPVLQAKLLRALESRAVEPVGGTGPRAIDVRVIAATNADLGQAMGEGRFREDLYFRLAVVEIPLAPLRDRPEDIRPLALYFAASMARTHGKPIRAITESALCRLSEYPWPGNVRELRNVLDRAVLMAVGSTIRSSHLRLDEASPRTSPRGGDGDGDRRGYPTSLTLAQVEADHIDRVVAAQDGHLGRAAEALGVHRNTLARKLRARGDGESDAGGGS